MPHKDAHLHELIRVTLVRGLTGLLLSLIPASQICASGLTSALVSINTDSDGDGNPSTTITLAEAEELIQKLPVTIELRAKGMDLKWDVQTGPTMNDKDYYFFWLYNTTAQKRRDIGSISVGNYAVNKHTADVRACQVSDEVFYGDDGVLVATDGLERLQDELRKKHNIDSTLIAEYRSAHLAKSIIPRALAQSAVRLPITKRGIDTAEVSCWGNGEDPISRLGRSRILSSSAGYRAYAEVEAIAYKPKFVETYSGRLCENRVKLFLAKPGESTFLTVLDSNSPKGDCALVEGADSCDVNGTQLVDWSNDGRFLLADLVLWEYESDSLLFRVPVIYDTANGAFVRPDVYHFFDDYYKTDFFKQKPNPERPWCEFQLRSEGFSSDGNLIISASPPSDDPMADEQVFCLDKKQTFLFKLATSEIKQLPLDYKPQHYASREPAVVPKP